MKDREFYNLVDKYTQMYSEQMVNPFANTMGNPANPATAGRPNMASFTGYTNNKPSTSSDPTGSSDPGSAMTSQFAAQAMGAGNNYEQTANQFINMIIGDVEKIANMRDASTAANTIKSTFSQLDPTGAEALTKSFEQSNFDWNEFKNVLRKKISQLGNVAGSLVG